MVIDMENIFEVENLSVSFKNGDSSVEVVHNISFDVKDGETLAIVGESGSGKTITAKSLMGLIELSGGEISSKSKINYKDKNILNFDNKSWQNFRGNECSMVFQDALTALNPTIKVGKQIRESIRNHTSMSKEDEDKKIYDLIERVELPDPKIQIGKYPFEMSGGQRQRIMIASALASNPNVIIADEPTTALDVTVQAQILKLLKSIQEEMKMTILLITHDLGIVADIADRVMVMYSGSIMEISSVKDIFYNPKHPYTWNLLGSIPNIYEKGKTYLKTIKGRPPELSEKIKGCPFAKRCQFAMEICTEEKPDLLSVNETDRKVACWLHHPNSGKANLTFEELLNEK